MLLKYSLATLVLLGALALAAHWRGNAEPPRATLAVTERVLKIVERGDYAAFIAEADPKVRKMRAEDFRLLAERHAARLRLGYQLKPLDERWRGDVHVSRWTVTFNDRGPKATLLLGLRDGHVATFGLY